MFIFFLFLFFTDPSFNATCFEEAKKDGIEKPYGAPNKKAKLLANVFEDYLFSFLFSHFTIFRVCFVWDLFANEVTDKSEVHPREFIKLDSIFSSSPAANSNHTHHASSNFISFIKFEVKEIGGFISEIGFCHFPSRA